MATAPGERVAEMIGAFMESRLLLVAVDLGIPDELAQGPLAVTELADRAGADADVLHRFLRALAPEGVFARLAAGPSRARVLLQPVQQAGAETRVGQISDREWPRSGNRLRLAL